MAGNKSCFRTSRAFCAQNFDQVSSIKTRFGGRANIRHDGPVRRQGTEKGVGKFLRRHELRRVEENAGQSYCLQRSQHVG